MFPLPLRVVSTPDPRPDRGVCPRSSRCGPAADGVSAADVDCSDFPNQRAAQQYFLNHGGPQHDPDGLDADGDGIACESNPCPCSTGGGGGGGGGDPAPPDLIIHQQARVIRVVDGDTITARLPTGRKEYVELIGLDAPTLRPKQCGGLNGRDALRDQLPRGTRVTLTSDRRLPAETSKGHLNRYVESLAHEAGRFHLLQGWAQVHPGNFARARTYDSAVRSARRHHRGIWGGCGR